MLSTSFRNTLIASTLLVGASILVSPAAMAADDPSPASDPGDVSSTVELINRVDFAPAATTRVQPVTAQTDIAFPLGTVTIRNNDPDGWNLTVASTNAGVLEFGTHTLSYSTITLADTNDITETAGGVDPATGGLLATGGFSTRVAGGTEAINVSALLTVPADVAAGAYTDTLTFTLTSK
ncbi:hypothetical protein [Phormidium sp. FACHB-1136]|uniref:hypothetical protein n=1 Tax=Phormidium sp. FACHB-1136 TaxID=2692848 RepID=UPI0016828FF7|nr:hypothetical protein [Phormidium sp. FACHB-1136]MBD2426266.1 hypothetical protein [Phormidium sp. FACHB-1136]